MYEALRLCRRARTTDHLNRLAVAVGRDFDGSCLKEVTKAANASVAGLKSELVELIETYEEAEGCSGFSEANLRAASKALGICMDEPAAKATAKRAAQKPATQYTRKVRYYGITVERPYIPSWMKPSEQPSEAPPAIDEDKLAQVRITPRNTGRGMKRKAQRAAHLGCC